MFDDVVAREFYVGVVPMQEKMTLSVKQPDNSFISYVIFRAKRRPLTEKEQSFRGASLAKGEQIIEVWQEALDDALLAGLQAICPQPKVADYWTDSKGVKWNIVALGTETGLFGARLNTHVQRQV